jgi:hypothetical protein
MTTGEFSFEHFEYHAWRGNLAEATGLLVAGLTRLEANNGRFATGTPAQSGIAAGEGDAHLVARFAAAASALLADPAWRMPDEHRERLLYLQRWLGAVFAASPFGNSDHVLKAMHAEGPPQGTRITVAATDIERYCLAWTPDSEIPIDIDAVWRANPQLALSVVISALAARVHATAASHARREAWLAWLTEMLGQTASLDGLPTGLLHHVYMNCSYADRVDKHAVKGAITALLRRVLARLGLHDTSRKLALEEVGDAGKPVMLVLLEQWLPGHSVYRTHAPAIEGARASFHTVAVGFEKWVAPECRASFDEFVALDDAPIVEQLKAIRRLSDGRKAQVLHFPSVGMFPLTMFAASLRLAPVQTMSTGHPATTNSPAMDFLLVEGHYLGDPGCWSEAVLPLPVDAIPYRPSRDVPQVVRTREAAPAKVRIAVCASIMKINPRFLAACAAIRDRAATPVEFHFFPALADGVVYWQLRKAVEHYLGADCAVYPHLDYAEYMGLLAGCDMFANSFPFGNTNGIVDTVTAGLPGVCKTGPEVHEHIDEGLFGRLGFPGWCVAQTVEDYVAAAVRLTDDPALREDIRERCCGQDKVAFLFGGKAEQLGETLLGELRRKVSPGTSPTPASQ